MTARPVPIPDEISAPYWAAAADHRLVIARCSRCRQLSHPPDVVCPRCHHDDPAFAFETVSGRGSICSWVVLRQSFLPGFEGDLPVVLVDVSLDGQNDLRLIGRLLNGVDPTLTVGARVAVAFEHLHDGTAVPAFTLARS